MSKLRLWKVKRMASDNKANEWTPTHICLDSNLSPWPTLPYEYIQLIQTYAYVPIKIMANTLCDMKIFTAPCHVNAENASPFFPNNSTIYSLTPSVFLIEISGDKGLAQVIGLHESLRIKYVILNNNIMAFQGENWNVISSPQIIRSIDNFPMEAFAFAWLKQQSLPFASRGHPAA